MPLGTNPQPPNNAPPVAPAREKSDKMPPVAPQRPQASGQDANQSAADTPTRVPRSTGP